jgi:hypothetical protein
MRVASTPISIVAVSGRLVGIVRIGCKNGATRRRGAQPRGEWFAVKRVVGRVVLGQVR